jgi:hypothetical protein
MKSLGGARVGLESHVGWVAITVWLIGHMGAGTIVRAQSRELSGIVVGNKKYSGQIVHRDATSLSMLRRDGAMVKYPMSEIDRVVSLKRSFEPYSQGELEQRLLAEFSRHYTVRFTDHFAVVMPANSRQNWAAAFERLYRQFTSYFDRRGYTLSETTFPMIAVVLRSRAEFEQYLERTNLADRPNVVGFYSIQSNRILTYEQDSLLSEAESHDINQVTMIHEATHQSAFNTGIQSRFRPVPCWVSEGLATMFEAKGVHNCLDYPSAEDRLAPVYLDQLRKLIADEQFRGAIQDLIVADDLFDSDPQKAYAVAWGLTFFLAENRGDQYQEYLRRLQRLAMFSSAGPEQRLRDFCSVFGDDLRDLETRMMNYYVQTTSHP